MVRFWTSPKAYHPDSPASRAGLKQGDVIRELNGEKMVDGSALQVAVSGAAPETEIALGILRNGSPQTIHVKVGEFHDNGQVAGNEGSDSSQGPRIGISVGDLTSDLRQQFNIPSQVHGVVVQSVRSGSPAEDAGIAPGDIILEVNRRPVASADAFVNDVHASPAGKDLLLLVWSQGNASFRVIHPETGSQNGM